MNKYQEALEHIIKCDREDCGMSYLSDAYRNDLSVLRELIEKATPKKPMYIKTIDEYRCKNCGFTVIRNWEKMKYCCNCGQKIDWSDRGDKDVE